ncbi:YhgE/Pip domain-containing protein [Paenibacillus sp. Leaf72]|uniref:YhgE/Pip domain-containing protein n=1 Tax=Paenibacillus sp. Leaf72 TaxID=1736234 RepID=UPI0007016EE1|nr:ABC transporter permease [Paenibacillus sp. Leaf72]KQO17904.1 hypothetical protein ASF12_04405 [Paenibacillus sp. Leaf72]
MKAFLKNKIVIGGIFMMVFYQIAMIGMFMYGYSAVPKNLPDLTVAIVSEDEQTGAKMVEQLKEQLPFHINTTLSLEQAKTELDNRNVHLIVHIPQNFTQQLSQPGEQAQLDFFMNDSNPATTSSAMQSVADQISSKMVAQIQTQSFEGLLQNMKLSEDQAKQMVEGVMTKVTPNMVVTNPKPAGMHNQMAPMFLAMAGYVGAMIYSMISVGALQQLKGQLGKWKAFFSLQGLNALLALIVPLIGLTIYFSIHGYGAETFLKVWMVHALELFTAISFTSIFCMLAGQAGMLLNMPLLLSQTIAGGAMMPQEMMPGLFKAISYISPMFYTIQLDYNLLFGGGQMSKYLLGLALIGVGALLINTLIHQFKGVKTTTEENTTAAQPQFM